MGGSVDNVLHCQIAGVRVDHYSQPQIIHSVITALVQERVRVLSTVNPEFIVAAGRHAQFAQVLNRSDWSVIDGVGIHWALRFLRRMRIRPRWKTPLVWLQTLGVFAFQSVFYPHLIGERVTGSDLLPALLRALPANTPIFVLGGKISATETLQHVLQKNYPLLSWVGVEYGPSMIRVTQQGIEYDAAEDAGLCEQIEKSGACIIIVGFGQIKQEMWIDAHREKFPKARVFMGVGGSLDFVSRSSRRSPPIVAQRGFEWLWRLIVEPRRWKRIVTATIVFPLMMLWVALSESNQDDRR